MASPVHPPAELSERVRALVEGSSIAGASRQLRLAEATVARLAGGLRVSEGTAAIAAMRMAEIGKSAA